MAAAGIVIAAGSITLANEAIFAPLAAGKSITASVNWRIIPATAGLAVALTGLGNLAPKFADGLAWLVLVAALLVKTGNAGSPIVNVTKALGYQ